MKKRKGASLIWVILALVFVSIATMSIATIVQANILQAKNQDDNLQAYYIARSGAELTYEALLTSSPSLITPFTVASNNGNTHILTPPRIDLVTGTADVVVKSTGTTTDANKRIRIESRGKLKTNEVTKLIILEFNATTYGDIRWTY